MPATDTQHLSQYMDIGSIVLKSSYCRGCLNYNGGITYNKILHKITGTHKILHNPCTKTCSDIPCIGVCITSHISVTSLMQSISDRLPIQHLAGYLVFTL